MWKKKLEWNKNVKGSTIHHHLSSNYYIFKTEHNTKYTWNYEYESTRYRTVINNILLGYWQHHLFISRMGMK